MFSIIHTQRSPLPHPRFFCGLSLEAGRNHLVNATNFGVRCGVLKRKFSFSSPKQLLAVSFEFYHRVWCPGAQQRVRKRIKAATETTFLADKSSKDPLLEIIHRRL